MSDDAEARRAHQNHMQSERLAEQRRRESRREVEAQFRQDDQRREREKDRKDRTERAEQHRQEAENRDLVRRQDQDALYRRRRSDQITDRQAREDGRIETEREKTNRSLAEIEAKQTGYADKLEDDYEHDARTRNLDVQQYEQQARIDTDAQRERLRAETLHQLSILAQESRNTVTEIKSDTQRQLILKLADHFLEKDLLSFKGRLEGQGGGALTPEVLDALHQQLKAIDTAPNGSAKDAKIGQVAPASSPAPGQLEDKSD